MSANPAIANTNIKIEAFENVYQWAIMDKDKVIGYFSYRIEPYSDSISSFGLYSFDKGNPIIGISVFKKLEELIQTHHRLEWRVISGNPVIKHYNRFCKRHSGNTFILHDVCKDNYGVYHDEYVYEIINNELHRGRYSKNNP